MKRIYIAGCGGMLGEGFYKQFKEALQSPTYTRSMVKRWKRSYYLRPRTESIIAYMNRLLDFKLP